MPRGMTDNQKEFWDKQLRHSHRVWDANGLSKAPGSSGAAQLDEDIRTYMDGYRGEQWEGSWGGIPEEDLSTTPLFFSATNTFQAQLLARTPEVQVVASRPSLSQTARIVQALYNYDVYELKFKRQWNMALRDSWFSPFGIVRHGFTPTEEHQKKTKLLERFSHARPDKPWMRAWKIWDFRLDPLAETPDSDGTARWCAFRTLMTMDEIRDNPAMIVPRDLTPTVSVEVRQHQQMDRLSTQEHPERQDFVEVWTVYEKMDRTWFQVAGSTEKILRQPEDWPIPWEDLPYDALYFNPQMDTFLPQPYAKAVWESCQERNKVRSLYMELVKRMRRLILANKDRLEPADMIRLMNADLMEIIPVEGQLADAIAEVRTGGFDQALLLLDEMYVKDVREALGQSSLDRGQRINVESAQEAAAVQQGGALHVSRNAEQIEDFLSSTIRHYAQARRATTTENELIPILGREDTSFLLGSDQEQRFITVKPEDLHGEFDYQIRAGSSLPKSKNQMVQEALGDLQVVFQFQGDQIHDIQELYRRYWHARGVDMTKVMLGAEELQASAGAQPPVGVEGQDTESPDVSPLIAALGNGGIPQ